MKHLLAHSLFISLLLISSTRLLQAQNIQVGSWRSHLPFHHITSLTHNEEEVIAATDGGVLFFNTEDESVRTLSTVNGLAGTNASAVQYDAARQQLIIAYNDLNIDIYKKNTTVNFPAIKNSGITGEKRIHEIYLNDNVGYVCGTFGIVLVDFENLVVNETYSLSDGSIDVEVFNVAENSQTLLAATELGIFEANLNNPNLFDVKNWVHHDSIQNINKAKVDKVVYANQTFYCLQNDIIYAYIEQKWEPFYIADEGQQIRNFAFNDKTLYTAQLQGRKASVVEFKSPNITQVFNHYSFQRPDELMFFKNSIWMGDNWEGLHEISETEIKMHRPSAPTDASVYALTTDNENNIWVAAGSAPHNFDSNIIYSNRGVYKFNNYGWNVTNTYSLQDSLFLDIVSIAVHPVSNVAYIGTYIYGLFELDKEKKVSYYNEYNSSIERSVGNELSIVGMGFDRNNNLWLSNNKTEKPIKLLTNEGEWKAFKPNFSLPSQTFTEILVTELHNQVWVVVDRKGILVYDYGEDVMSTADDRYVFLNQNEGSGNLPNEQVYAMEEDKDGEIWVGTTEGIGIYFCPSSSLFDAEGCDAYIPIVQIDDFPAPLLESDVINCIKKDNANRKWVGTGNGVWLLSEDGDEVIHRFTTQNSPLPANEIKDIAINKQTGEVFIGTSKGIVSYRGSASQGQNYYNEVNIFPNPVKPTYQGPITIKNLLDDSNVKITDASGNLVYETTSLGGQVVWNGADYTGRKVSSGVYVVFATNSDGSAGYEGKIMIIR